MEAEKNNYKVQKVSSMSRKELIFFMLIAGFGVISIATYFVWWFNGAHLATNGATFWSVNLLLFVLLSTVTWHGLFQRLAIWYIVFFMRKPVHIEPEPGLKVALLTCFVPGKEPYDLLEKTLQAMTEVEYPHDTWVLDEGDDFTVKDICYRLGVNHFSRKGIPYYNQESGSFKAKTKAGNHNAWRDSHEYRYDFVAQMDMDHVPHKDYLHRILGYFRDEKVAFVVAPQIYTNTENWIAAGAAEQAHIFHGPLQQGFYGQDMPLFIGTNHAYRATALQQVGGYASTIVEDHLTGMHFFANGWKGVYVPEAIAEGEGPTNWGEYFSQQMRWSYGIFEILFKHTPSLLPKLSWGKRINYLAAQTYYFTGVVSMISIFLTSLYLVFGYSSADFDLWGWFLYAYPPFAASLFIQYWIQRFYLNPKKESGIGWRGMLLTLGSLPIYAIAFYKVVTGQKLQYAVTAKGSSVDSERLPLHVFAPHIWIILISSIALGLSFWKGNDVIQLRFWAAFTIAFFGAVVASSGSLTLEPFWNWFYRPVNLTAIRVATIALLVFVFTFSPSILNTVAAPAGQLLPIISSVSAAPKKLETEENKIYLGFSGGDVWNKASTIEDKTGKKILIIGKYTNWGDSNPNFDKAWAKQMKDQSYIPLITWEPWSTNYSGAAADQPDYKLSNIYGGNFDPYIVKFAKDIKEFDGPIVIRFAHEMNGSWYPWGGDVNGNTPDDYKRAWIHVHNIFSELGVKNVTWIWAPNEPYLTRAVPNSTNYDAYYPGENYVDWVGFSAFNWGGTPGFPRWRSFSEIVEPAYNKLILYNKPIMITEMNSATLNGNKSEWMRNMNFEILKYPKIKAVIWFETSDNSNFKIDTSPDSYTSF